MIPQTFSKVDNGSRAVPVRCVPNDDLNKIEIVGDCFLLLIINKGRAYFKVENFVFEAIAPCFVCFDERKTPSLIQSENLECNAIYFQPTFLNVNMTMELVHNPNYDQAARNHDLFLLKPFTDGSRFVFYVHQQYANRAQVLFEAMERELREQPDWYWSCRGRSYFMELMLLLERTYGTVQQDVLEMAANKIRNPQLKNTVIFIESNYSKDITLEDITDAVGVNHSTLTRMFKRELDITPMEYLWRHRVIVAQKHLEFTSLTIKEISFRCGFKTVPHFNRKVKQYLGDTPLNFRKRAVEKRKNDFNNINNPRH